MNKDKKMHVVGADTEYPVYYTKGHIKSDEFKRRFVKRFSKEEWYYDGYLDTVVDASLKHTTARQRPANDTDEYKFWVDFDVPKKQGVFEVTVLYD